MTFGVHADCSIYSFLDTFIRQLDVQCSSRMEASNVRCARTPASLRPPTPNVIPLDPPHNNFSAVTDPRRSLSTTMAANIPASLKAADIGRFAIRAAQVERAKPVIAYWCEYL